jgi:hypothetical protein
MTTTAARANSDLAIIDGGNRSPPFSHDSYD